MGGMWHRIGEERSVKQANSTSGLRENVTEGKEQELKS